MVSHILPLNGHDFWIPRAVDGGELHDDVAGGEISGDMLCGGFLEIVDPKACKITDSKTLHEREIICWTNAPPIGTSSLR